MILKLIITTLTIFFLLFIQANGLKVAVVDYQPNKNDSLSSEKKLQANLDTYIEIINDTNKVRSIKLDLIVFPEATLNAGDPSTDLEQFTVEVLQFGDNPCKNESYPAYIRQLSCTCFENSVYVVINTVERELCTDNVEDVPNSKRRNNCKLFGYRLYNSNVVFNRQGLIVNSYRKYNLFGEYNLDIPSYYSVSFLVDEQYAIGVFTCFDILFKTPAEDLIYANNISYFVFPSMWFGELPFLTALQAQQMWSQAHDVTLFASGASNPQVGSGGSAIYLGKAGPAELLLSAAEGAAGAAIFNIENPPEPRTHDALLDASKELDAFKLIVDPSLPAYAFAPLTQQTGSLTVTSNGLKCEFAYEKTQNADGGPTAAAPNRYTYLAVAYAGVRSFSGLYDGGVELCAVVACLDAAPASCGRRFADFDSVAWPEGFETIEISAEFAVGNRTQYPNSLRSDLRPVSPSATSWTSEEADGKVKRVFKLVAEQSHLLTFAIYGRNFNLDSDPNASNALQLGVSSLLVVFSLICAFFQL